MITFYLALPHREKSSIIMSVSFRNKQYKRSTNESTLVKFWNAKRQRVQVTLENRGASRVNDALDRWESAAKGAYLAYRHCAELPTVATFSKTLEDEYYKDDLVTPDVDYASAATQGVTLSFLDYFRSYIERYDGMRSKTTCVKYHTVLNKLCKYEQLIGRRLLFADININFYNHFRSWIYGQNYTDNYFGTLIKVIKQVYREARDEDHVHSLNATSHRNFVTTSKECDAIYLTTEELMKLHHLVLTKEKILTIWAELSDERAIQRRISTCDLVRNRFLIGAFSGLRVSDFSRMGEMDIVDDVIMMRTRKTDTLIAVPLHPVIRDILKNDFDLSKTISDQKMNAYIKSIARMAEIDDKVTMRVHRGGCVCEVCKEKCELVTTHTARRSFATNLLKAKDVPLAVISKALGHSKITTTMRYLRVGVEDNVEILASSSYYQIEKDPK